MVTLDGIAAQPDQKNKIEQYKAVLQHTVSSGSVKECQKFADHSNDSMHMLLMLAVMCRPRLTYLNMLPQYCQTLCLWL